ncbi:MAG: monofunctional biosynthetic peptidoglycan transglycosylase [Hyphomicrobium sp.]|nr:monofunctional biosynthetic peptidoglycan transglycosylase [Hyphomicrobium sp.]
MARRVPARPMLVLRVLKIAAGVVAAYLALVIVLLVAYRFVDPPFSSLMAQKLILGQDVTQVWVPLDRISPDVVHAVLVSEDGRFCQHNGVDFEEIQNAIERAGDDGVPRGASTISMQVIKNLFLWPSRSYLRKVIEFPLTYLMELLWPKRRIMEIYLNIAEWGPGVFGVEAASQFHFNKGAAQLNEREAARLAVALPNPLLRDAGAPGPLTRRLASDIESRARAAGTSQTACVDVPRRAAVKSAAPTRPAFRDPRVDWQPSIRRD